MSGFCKPIVLFCTGLILVSIGCPAAQAHQPIIEQQSRAVIERDKVLDLTKATGLKNPTFASLAVYGALVEPSEVDLYSFTTEKDAELPIEVLVPVRTHNRNFYPAFVLISPSQGAQQSTDGRLPFILPEGFTATVVEIPRYQRDIFFEPFSSERLYRGKEETVSVSAGTTYYLTVYEPEHYTGDYSLGIGTVENFSDVSFLTLIQNVLEIKLGITGGRTVPWVDIIGLFLFMAGFIIGLGAVTVVGLPGFLARKSPYWTEVTTRMHKISKPVIWIGIGLATVGALIYYRVDGLSGTAVFHVVLLLILGINGLFTSFIVSPYLHRRESEGKTEALLPAKWRRRITLSFIISFIGWWLALFFLVWHLLFLR